VSVIHFDISTLEKKIKILEEETGKDGFWNDLKKSTAVLSELKQYQNKVSKYNRIEDELQNLVDLNELLTVELDEDLVKELLKNTTKVENEINLLEIETLFSGKYDKNNAIITIHPGARWNRITRLGSNAL